MRDLVVRTDERGGEFLLGRDKFANLIVPTLERPDEVWALWDKGAGEYRNRYIKVFRSEDKTRPVLAIVRDTGDNSLFVTFFQANWDYIDRQRVGNLIHRRVGAR